jgi:succinoglycan biosynthesis protein ExoO
LSEGRVLQSLHRIESRVLCDPDLSELYQESKAENGLTIFIPNWNHRPYLPCSINSALQAVRHLEEAGFSAEILVIDDASRDGSQKLLRSVQMLYAGFRLKTLFLKQNLGLPRLRNLALQVSQFRYVCMLDADDELVPDNLPLFLQSAMETQAALVYGNLILKQGEKVVRLLSDDVATTRLAGGNYIAAFALVDARRLLRVGGYISDPQLYEDWEMILHLIAEEERIVLVPAVMGYVYRNPGSLVSGETSSSSELRHRRQMMKALVQRIFAQTGTRDWDSAQVGCIYHPSVGFIGQW